MTKDVTLLQTQPDGALFEKIIPILPCPDIKKQVEFYQVLGFELTGLYTTPNPYASFRLGALELHFYGSRKVIPAVNSSICFLSVANVDAVYNSFINAIKAHTGKIPRSGIPRISKVRDLVGDRRFTLTDTGGNTIYVGTPVKSGDVNFFRTLENKEHAKQFAVLYDVLYSKEDPHLAASMLPKYTAMTEMLSDLDKAKYLLVVLDIQLQLNLPADDTELNALMDANNKGSDDWEKIKNRYVAVQKEV